MVPPSPTSSPNAERLRGSQRPRVALLPDAADRTYADEAAFLGDRFGLTPDDWQTFVLSAWLGVRDDGRWAAPRAGLAVPRQNGKNGALELRELFGMVVLGERFLHTAHEVKTARKAFARLLSFFDNPRQFPELADMVREVRRTNGQEAIVLTNGGSVEFVARSKGSGRGFSVDVLVLDEAQDLSEDALAALLPTVSASANPQQLVMGTPPGPSSVGEVFTRMRRSGIAGDTEHLAWLEWSVDEQATDSHGKYVPVDVADERLWAATNPAFGVRLMRDTIAAEAAAMDPETFARERLGVWARGQSSAVIAADVWKALADPEARMMNPVVLAIDVSPGPTPKTSIGVAGRTATGRPSIELVENRAGTDWVVDRVVELVERHDPAALIIDGGSPAAALIAPLATRGIEVATITGRDMAAACGLLYADATQNGLFHLGDPALTAALENARKRPIGSDGAWAWNRKSSTDDITPLVAVTLARHGLEKFGRPKPAAPPPRQIASGGPLLSRTADVMRAGF